MGVGLGLELLPGLELGDVEGRFRLRAGARVRGRRGRFRFM